MTPNQLNDAYSFDLDGTCYLGEALMPTVAEMIGGCGRLGGGRFFC